MVRLRSRMDTQQLDQPLPTENPHIRKEEDPVREWEGSVAERITPAARHRAPRHPEARLIGDRVFTGVTFVLALSILALLLSLGVALIVTSFPAIRQFGI